MNSFNSLLLDSDWRHQLGPRVRLFWVTKMLATTLGITAFFVAYFWILRHPFFPITIMPVTVIDRLIAFRPETLPLYASLWFYLALPPALLKDGREVRTYGLATFALSVIGLSIFLIWPTAAPEFEIDWSQHPSMSFLKTMDVAANACPSLHAAFAVFTGIWLERLLRELHAQLQRQRGPLPRALRDADDQPFEQRRGTVDEVDVAVRDRVERAGVDRDAGGRAHSFERGLAESARV